MLKRPAAAPTGSAAAKRPADVKRAAAVKRPAGSGGATPTPVADFYSEVFLVQHIKDIVSFYEPRVVDPTGGFFQSFYIDGTKFDAEKRQIVSSTRMVINFMLAGKLLGRQDLIDIGRHGLDYVEKVHYVTSERRYAFTVVSHKPDDMIQQAYGYAFILAAHAAARSAGAAEDDSDVARIFDIMEERFYLPEKGAYLDTISAEGVVDNSYRGQNSNMHICEALIAAYEATKEMRYLARAAVLADTYTRKLAGKANGYIWEHYTADFEIDWEYNKHDPTNIYRPWGFQPGHQNEWAKNLLNIYRYAPQPWMVKRAQELFDGSWDLSWDAEYGGLVYGFGPDHKWCDAEKYFWVQGESMATAALLHQATGDAKYVERYNTLWRYIWEHWVDHKHGAWLCFKMTRENKRNSDVKAFAGGKCDYHTLVSCIEALRAFK